MIATKVAEKRVWTFRVFRIPWGRMTLWQHHCGYWYDPEDFERGYWCGGCGINLVTGTKASPRSADPDSVKEGLAE